MTVDTAAVNINIPSNPADQEKIRKNLQEISDFKLIIESQRTLIKEKIAAMAEEFEIPKKVVAKMANVFHKDNFSKEVAEQNTFEVLYETITGQTTPDGI